LTGPVGGSERIIHRGESTTGQLGRSYREVGDALDHQN
jgi:hypothetical protein